MLTKILEKICSRLMSVYFGFQFMDFAVAVVMLVAVVTTHYGCCCHGAAMSKQVISLVILWTELSVFTSWDNNLEHL